MQRKIHFFFKESCCAQPCAYVSRQVFLTVKGHVAARFVIVQELCESRGGRPRLSVLTSLLVSVDVKIY